MNFVKSVTRKMSQLSALDDTAVARFVSYLQIKTVQPNPDYKNAAVFLQEYASELGLSSKVVEVHKDRPVVIITWKGSKDSQAGSILLNSHVDVVPVDEEKWNYPPFAATRDNGRIYARGSQDMKVIGIQYMEAIRRLKSSGFVPQRSVHLTFVPDEEIGGHLGMMLFVKMKEFKDLNVAFALDEGCPSLTDEVPVFYGERAPWWIRVKCKGTPGHGSLLKKDTAGEKFWRFTDKLMRFRDGQKAKFEWSYPENQQMGETFSVNLTMVEGGKQPNVIPSELCATFDIRIPPYIDLAVFEEQLNKWAQEIAVECGGAADSIEFEYPQKDMCQATCDVTVKPGAIFWDAFREALVKHSIKPRLSIFPAATDCRYIREFGIPALGFSPLPQTPFLLHDHDEYVGEDVFLNGIAVYEDIIRNVTAVDI